MCNRVVCMRVTMESLHMLKQCMWVTMESLHMLKQRMRVTMESLHMLKQCILDVPFRLFNFLKVRFVLCM